MTNKYCHFVTLNVSGDYDAGGADYAHFAHFAFKAICEAVVANGFFAGTIPMPTLSACNVGHLWALFLSVHMQQFVVM